MEAGQHRDNRAALPFVLPFVIVYAVLFVFPTLQMVAASFTDASLTLPGKWVGGRNYSRLFEDVNFWRSLVNTGLFALFTVLPSTLLGLLVAMTVNRLDGRVQAVVMALFFLPYVLPAAVIANIWYGLLDPAGAGILAGLADAIVRRHVSVLRIPSWFLPTVALITVWWTLGFNILLFLAGLRNISPDLYEAATLDNASRWTQFRLITWPLIWPVTALVLTIQLILQLKAFDQIYLLTTSSTKTMVLVQYIYTIAFSHNESGYASTIALALFLIVTVISVLQFQLIRARGDR
jgi:multiple sugar transport system permease protein